MPGAQVVETERVVGRVLFLFSHVPTLVRTVRADNGVSVAGSVWGRSFEQRAHWP
jgi:hypothetical protein